MKTVFAILLLIIGITLSTEAQNQKEIDSLQQVLNEVKNDTQRVATLINLCDKLIKITDFDLANKYADDALQLSEKVNYQKGISDALSVFGSIKYNQGDFDEAMIKFSSALKIKEKIGDKKGMARAYGNIGLIHMNKGNYAEAMENNLKSLKIRRELKDDKNTGSTLLNIANIYLMQGNYPAALKNYYEALKSFEATGEKSGIAFVYMNIGRIYYEQKKHEVAIKNVSESLKIAEEIGNKKIAIACHNNLGNIYDDLGNYDKALQHYSDCIEIAEAIGSKHEIASAYSNIGTIYFNQKKYDAALINFMTSLKSADAIGDKDVLINLYNNIGKIYLHQNKYAESEKYLLKGYLMAKEIGSKLRVKECLEGLTELEEHLGHYKQSLDYLKLYVTYKDSLLNESSNLQLTEMQTKYESEKDEKEIALLTKDKVIQNIEIKKQKQLKYSLIGGLGLVLILVFLGYRTYRTRQLLKLQTLRNKIASDLHDDVGSTLTSIALFSDVALQQSKDLMPMVQSIGESSRKMLDSMADIVWTINPENDNFENIILRMRSFAYELLGAKQIDFDFKADGALSQTKLSMEARKNLYLIFKEATNNLVKYSEANRVSFSITGTKDNLTMMIRDNGKGFDIEKLTQGNGLKNMKTRATEIGAKLLIESEPNNGTTIQLILAA